MRSRATSSCCPLLLAPVAGSSAYPATLFTDAPTHVLRAAIAAASHMEHPGPLAGLPAGTLQPTPAAAASTLAPPPLPHNAVQHAPQGPPPRSPGLPLVQPPLLELRGVTLRRPDGGLAVSQLTLALPRGAHLLISGPNGCGKSTLLKALCGLLPLEAGWARVGGAAVVAAGGDTTASAAAPLPRPGPAARPLPLPAAVRQSAASNQANAPAADVMVVPQRPLVAPGSELWRQVAYPDTRQLAHGELRRLLSAVGLGYLEARAAAGGCCGAELSPGELQRLSVARVLHRCVHHAARPAVQGRHLGCAGGMQFACVGRGSCAPRQCGMCCLLLPKQLWCHSSSSAAAVHPRLLRSAPSCNPAST